MLLYLVKTIGVTTVILVATTGGVKGVVTFIVLFVVLLSGAVGVVTFSVELSGTIGLVTFVV